MTRTAASAGGATRRTLLKLAAAGAVAVPVVAATAACSGSGDDAGDAAPTGTVEERNKTLVTTMIDQIYGTGATDRIDDYVAGGYIEHDPAIADGRAGLVAWAKAEQAMRPRVVTTVKHVLAQGTLVGVHSHRSTDPADERTGTSVMEIFDVRDGKIVEHWAYKQPVAATSRSGYSMFSNEYRYPGTPPTVSAEQADANKQLILKAWAAVYSARDFTVLDRYWALGDGYLQHNPNVPNGVGGLRGFLSGQPTSVSQNRFALGSDDLVMTVNQSLPTGGDLDSDATGSTVADIYRIVDGRAVEHWDVVATVPTSSANSASMFSRLYRES